MFYKKERIFIFVIFLLADSLNGQNRKLEMQPLRHQNLLFGELASTMG